MPHRYEMPQAHWDRIARFFPVRDHRGGRGRPLADHRPMVNGILWRLHTGAPWRDIPDRSGPWETVYGRFLRWRRDGTWAKILTALLRQADRGGQMGRDLGLVVATVVRASRAAGGAEKKAPPGPDARRAEGGATPGAGRPCV